MAAGVVIAARAEVAAGVCFRGSATVEAFCVVGVAPDPREATTFGPDCLLRTGTVLYSGNRVGRSFRTGNKANVREHNSIGDHVSIGSLSVVEHHATLGDRVRIHSQAFIPEFTVIEDDVWIGPHVVLTNARFPGSANAKGKLQACRLERGCRIGANATLLPGVVVGAGALIGAGSLVTRSVPAGEVWFGAPATRQGLVSDIADYATSDPSG